jgi:hypothetical protein
VYNFESLKLLLNNYNLTEICINTIPPFKRNESKYIYIKDGMAYTFKKNFWGIQSYGNELDKKFEKIMINKFSEDLKIINSQGFVCLLTV